jgi:hypothetical protein
VRPKANARVTGSKGSSRTVAEDPVSPGADEPTDGLGTVRLNEAQRRHIGLMLNRLARETREWLRDWDDRGVSGPAADRLLGLLEDLLVQAESASNRLAVEVLDAGPDPRRRLAAWSSAWWSMVLDARPRALGAYGDLDPAAAVVIGPLVETLAETLLRVKTLAAGPDVGP